MQNYSGIAAVQLGAVLLLSLLYATANIFGLQVLHSFSSDHDECPGKNDSSLLSIPETVKLNGEDVTKEFGMY